MRTCGTCGTDMTGRRAKAVYCSRRCRYIGAERPRRSPHIEQNPNEAPRWPKSGKPTWPRFEQVAGPPVTGRQRHLGTVSDRDPKTGRSAWEETEERNRRALEAAGLTFSPGWQK